MAGASQVASHTIDTPFGQPSGPVSELLVDGRTLFFIPRHGAGHQLLPSEVPYRANIYSLKTLGVTHVLAVSAVGIMREDIAPGNLVVPDQLFDRTKGIRPSTFFGDGIAGHVLFADPFCEEMRRLIISAARDLGAKVHSGGSYICMEGPQFSTRAESTFYRETLKPAVIGMTGLPEANLAREAELAYGMLALATDYDCWHTSEEDVSVTAVLAVLKANAALANEVVQAVLRSLPDQSTAPSLYSAEHAIITNPDQIAPAVKERLQILWGQYLGN